MAVAGEEKQLDDAVALAGQQFCSPYSTDLTMKKKACIGNPNFQVTDAKGKILLELHRVSWFFRRRRLLLDAAGNPLLTIQPKLLSAHCKWNVFRGKSSDPNDLLFSCKKPRLLQYKTEIYVFMASNTNKKAFDFRIKSNSFFGRSCTIYLGDTNTVIANMTKDCTAKSILLGKDTLRVAVSPNVDYAFIVSLIFVFNEIDKCISKHGHPGGGP